MRLMSAAAHIKDNICDTNRIQIPADHLLEAELQSPNEEQADEMRSPMNNDNKILNEAKIVACCN